MTFTEQAKSISMKAHPHKHGLVADMKTHTGTHYRHRWVYPLCESCRKAESQALWCRGKAPRPPAAARERDNVRWAVRCNWSVDYYQARVCRIKTPLKIHTECLCGAGRMRFRKAAELHNNDVEMSWWKMCLVTYNITLI